MTPEQQARLDELRRKAAQAAVPPETVSSSANPAAPGPSIQNPPTLTPEQQARLEILRRKAGLQQGSGTAVLPAAGAQAAEGFVVGAGTMAGAVAGAKGGATAGAGIGTLIAPGPGTAAGTAIGGGLGFVAGAVAGAVAGDMAFRPTRDILIENGYMYPSIADAPDTVRPYLYGAQSLGGSAAGLGAMNFLAQSSMRMAPSTVGRFVNGTLDALKARPVVQNIREGMAATGAAAGVTAAGTRTDNPWILLSAELAGGYFGSFSPTVRFLDYVVRGGNRIAQRFLSTSQETEAGRVLADAFRRYGEDPVQAMASIEAYLDAGEDLPPALWMDSPAYRAMTNFLRAQDSEAASRLRDATQKWFDVQARMVAHLRRTGDPRDLVTAARLEQDMMDQFMTSTLNDAQQKVVESTAGFTRMDMLDRQRLSTALNERFMEVNDRFKAEEARLWSAVDRDLEADTDVFVQGMDALSGQYTPELRSLASPIVKQFLNRITGRATATGEDALLSGLDDVPGLREFAAGLAGASDAPEPPKVWELQQMRSLVLSLQRGAASGDAPNSTLVSYYGDVANLLLLQIDAAMPPGMDQAYDAARSFTKAYHDVFSRSFVGESTTVTRTGAVKLAPELMVKRALAGGPEATALRFREMEEAINFLPGMGLDDPANALAIADMQNRILRSFAADTIDAAGRIAPKKAQKFLNDHAILLDRFPEVRDELTNALESDDALRKLEDGFKEVVEIRKEMPGLNRALDVDNAATAVAGAMSHPTNPITQFRALAQAAREADPKAARALVAATLDWATGTNGTDDIAEQLRALTSPIGRFSGRAPGGGDAPPSPIRILYEEGVINLEELGRIELMAERVARVVERAADTRMAAGIEAPETLLDMILVQNLRFAGAVAGSAMRGGLVTNAGTGLQAAKQGSDLFAKVFDRLPQEKVRQLILKAIEDPKLMVLLLEKAQSPAQQLAVTKQALAYVLPALGTSISGDDGIQFDFGSGEQ